MWRHTALAWREAWHRGGAPPAPPGANLLALCRALSTCAPPQAACGLHASPLIQPSASCSASAGASGSMQPCHLCDPSSMRGSGGWAATWASPPLAHLCRQRSYHAAAARRARPPDTACARAAVADQPRTSGGALGAAGYGPGDAGAGGLGARPGAAADDAAQGTAPSPLLGLFDGGADAERRRAALTPSAVVASLDEYIVGQAEAKRAVAVALRNRWRRHRLPPGKREEVVPRNILMVGPTGCGKTEVARRLAKLADAPFIKVEATKFTELGFVGRDVEDIVKDLVEASLQLTRSRLKARLTEQVATQAEVLILAGLCGEHATPETLDQFRPLYRDGTLDDRMIELDGSALAPPADPLAAVFGAFSERMGAAGAGRAGGGLGGALGMAAVRAGAKVKMRVSEARSLLMEQEREKWLSSEAVTREALRAAEQDGIVFIDEIDKIVDARGGGGRGGDGGVSSDGVQRDLLPILEGSTVATKHGNVSTDHVLFICSGAFHSCKPSDMLAELQGRLPIRVELTRLTAPDFYRILTVPRTNMIRQQQALLATEGVELSFTDGAVTAIADCAEEANRLLDNIGARRLHTILEHILSEVSFAAPQLAAAARARGEPGHRHVVTEVAVQGAMQPLLKQKDLSKYIL